MDTLSQLEDNTEDISALDKVLLHYMELAEAGGVVNRQTWINSHSNVAAELRSYFAAEDLIARVMRRNRSTSTSSSSNDANGRVFGSYQLLEKIGQGGMGVVYKARDQRLDRFVALKLIRLVSDDALRSKNEAEAVSQLDHPSIVPIYDFGQQDGHIYFTMKLIEGENLSEWKARNRTGADNAASLLHQQTQVARIVRDVALAVHHAHQRGILHRDLKPSNILLDRDHRPYVVDFGLAKQMNRELDMTMTGAMIGTPSYMAPELVASGRSQASPRTSTRTSAMTIAVDVYGLGGILYFLLTGEAPFRGESLMETLMLVRERTLPSLRGRFPGVPKDLDAICQKCLDKEPRRRYATAETLAEDLDRWLSGAAIVARPLSVRERTLRWCRQHIALLCVVIAILASALFGVMSLAVGYRAATIARDEAIGQRRTALANLRSVISEFNDLENRRPDLDEMRLELLSRVQTHLEPMLNDPVHGTLADETNFWLEIDAGDVCENRRNTEEACKHFERALSIAERLPRDSSGTQQRLYSFTLSHIGDGYGMQGRHQKACEAFEACVAIREKIFASNSSAQARADLGLAHLKLSTSLRHLNSQSPNSTFLMKSRQHAILALPIFEQLVKEEPTKIWHVRFLGYARDSIARAMLDQRRFDESIDQSQRGVGQLSELRNQFPDYQMIIDIHICCILEVQAWSEYQSGRFIEAVESLKQSLRFRSAAFQANPKSISLGRAMFATLDLLGQAQMAIGDPDASAETFRELFRGYKQLQGEMIGVQDIAAEVRLMLDHCIYCMLPHVVLDDITRNKFEERLVLGTRDCESFHIDAHRSRMLFSNLIECTEFEFLDENPERASELLRSAAEHLRNCLDIEDRPTADKLLEQHERMSQALGDDGADPARELIDIVDSRGMMMRLQRLFHERQDSESLARASLRLDSMSDSFFESWSAAQGLGQAVRRLPTGNRKTELVEKLVDMLARLTTFGAHIADRIAADDDLCDFAK